MVTAWFAVKVMGLPGVPELAGLIPEVTLYVPALTSTVSPAPTFMAAAAAVIVQNGCAGVPALAPVSLQAEFVLSTIHVVDAEAAVPPVSTPATRTAPNRADQLAARSRLPDIRQPSRQSKPVHGTPPTKTLTELHH